MQSGGWKKLMRQAKIAQVLVLLGAVLSCCTESYGQNPLALSEPIVVNSAHAYPTVPSPPGSLFQPVSSPTNSIMDQLAHSSNGIVRLPPGDYSISVRLY
jgi:hypothetical protein